MGAQGQICISLLFLKYTFKNHCDLKIFFNLFLVVLGLRCYAGFSLAAVSGAYSLVAVRGLLIAVVSPVVAPGL